MAKNNLLIRTKIYTRHKAKPSYFNKQIYTSFFFLLKHKYFIMNKL
ncbi:hypothetical protein CCAND38_90002 [Capnocytophaga canis]|uniref:Uncharacterized protein n=1 Tax=Capnocytophaga canis TaxID=1848903 RepID=A0A0B7ICM8_9FLAO|nr:hypothetical protein CCAND38_90002 [Capnocytophaga canis]